MGMVRGVAETGRQRGGMVPAPTAPQPQENADDLIARGNALQAQGKHAKALPLFQRATQLAPKSFSAWSNLGDTFNMLKRFAEAEQAHDQALTINPKDSIAWNNKGYVLRDQGRAAEAKAAEGRAKALRG